MPFIINSSSIPAPLPSTSGSTADLVLTSLGGGQIQIEIDAPTVSGKSIIEYIIERSANGVDGWLEIVASEPAVASEVPARNVQTPTKWVHPSGTLDGNPAYTTLDAADNDAVPGDVIVVDGDFTGSNVFINTSGTVGNRIYWRAFDYDNPPTINGQGIYPIGWSASGNAAGSTALVNIQAEYVTFDGFNIINSKEHGIAIGACNNNGSFFFVPPTWYKGIEVYRCTVNTASQGLVTWCAEDWKVGGCDFSRCQNGTYWDTAAGNPVGWGMAIMMAGRNGWFVENTVRQTMGEGIHVGHHINVTASNNQAAGIQGFTIRKNKIYDCWSDPIYLVTGTDGVIEQNTIFMSDDPRFWYNRNNATGYPLYCLGIGGELGAFSNPTTVYDSDYNGVRDVIIRNNILNGANLLLDFVRFEDPHKTKNIQVDHNTIFAPKGAYDSIYQALRNIQTTANEMTGIKFRNNAILVSDSSDIFTTWNTLGSGKQVQGNLFSHSGPGDLGDATNITNSSSSVINDKTYSVTGNTYPTDATFDTTKAEPFYDGVTVSPLVNAVDNVGATVDFYGRTRQSYSGKVDIGAISLSKLSTATYIESGLAPGTYYYRARTVNNDLSMSSYLFSDSITI
jgi:Right handed beta helix region